MKIKNMLLPIALLVSFLWALTPIAHKFLLKTMPYEVVMVAASFAYMAAALVFCIIHWKNVRSSLPKIDARQFLLIIFIGVVAGFLANLMYYTLLNHHNSTIVTALTFTSPVFTAIIAYFLLNEQLTYREVFAVVIIVVGVVLLALPHNKERFDHEFRVTPMEE